MYSFMQGLAEQQARMAQQAAQAEAAAAQAAAAQAAAAEAEVQSRLGAQIPEPSNANDNVPEVVVTARRPLVARIIGGVRETFQDLKDGLPGDGSADSLLSAFPLGASFLEGTLAAAGATIFKTAHYASRLEAAGVDVARAESAVSEAIVVMRPNMAADAAVRGRIMIDSVLVEYRAMLLPNGAVNVGTIFPVGP